MFLNGLYSAFVETIWLMATHGSPWKSEKYMVVNFWAATSVV